MSLPLHPRSYRFPPLDEIGNRIGLRSETCGYVAQDDDLVRQHAKICFDTSSRKPVPFVQQKRLTREHQAVQVVGFGWGWHDDWRNQALGFSVIKPILEQRFRQGFSA